MSCRTVAWWMLDLWFGLDASGFDNACECNRACHFNVCTDSHIDIFSEVPSLPGTPAHDYIRLPEQHTSPNRCVVTVCVARRSPLIVDVFSLVLVSVSNGSRMRVHGSTHQFVLDFVAYVLNHQRRCCSRGMSDEWVEIIELILCRPCSAVPSQRLRGRH